MLVLSNTLLFIGLILSGAMAQRATLRILIGILLFAHISASTGYYVCDYFTGKGINEAVLYHLFVGLEGAGFGEYLSIALFGTAFLLAALLLASLYYFQAKKRLPQFRNSMISLLSLLFLIAAILTHKTTLDVVRIVKNNLKADLAKKQNTEEFQKFYSVPQKLNSTKKYNVVFIYAESLEQTYFDTDLFPGLTKDLDQIEFDYNFTNISQLWATGWTVAGMFGTQCGFPLAVGYNDMLGATRSFYNEATCIGDLLKNEKYKLSFIQGTSIKFSGIENIFKSHGFTSVEGSESLIKNIPNPDKKTHWGIFDEDLFPLVKKHLSHLSARKGPFAIFLATMDTHHPKGHYSPSCGAEYIYQGGKNDMLNAVHCSQKLIASFIRDIQISETGKNTIIVVASDHLAMKNGAIETLEKGRRKNLFRIFLPEKDKLKKNIDRPGSILDLGPTLLGLLNFKGGLGLGKDLLSKSAKTLVETYKDPDSQLQLWRNNIGSLWAMPKISRNSQIEVRENSVIVNNQFYKFPLVIEINSDLSITPQFGKRVAKSLNRIDGLKPFLWIDNCNRITGVFSLETIKNKFCFAIGKLNFRLKVDSLKNNSKISASLFFPTQPDPLQVAFNKEKLKNLFSKKKVKSPSCEPFWSDKKRYIAHAGGQIDGYNYTNSKEALDSSYKKGFRMFELDISKTSDGIYVAAHDWTSWKNKTGFKGKKKYIPSLADFKKYRRKNGLTSMAIEDINRWFEKHPDAYLITDKVDKPLDFSMQFKFKDRLMMELFSKRAVAEAKQINIQVIPSWLHIIKKIPEAERNHFFSHNKIEYMSMPIGEVKLNKKFLTRLKEQGIKIFLYHINYKPEQDEKYVTCNLHDLVYGMYADTWIFPKKLNCKKLGLSK